MGFYQACTVCKYNQKIVEEYGITFRTDRNQMWRWMGNRIFLEWPYNDHGQIGKVLVFECIYCIHGNNFFNQHVKHIGSYTKHPNNFFLYTGHRTSPDKL